VDVVSFGEGIGNELSCETDADLLRIGAGAREDAIIETAAATEAAAAGIEGETRAEEGVDVPDGDFVESGAGFEDSEGTRREIGLRVFNAMKTQGFALNARIHPEVIGVAGDKSGEIDFTGQSGENRHGPQGGTGGQPVEQGLADDRRIGRAFEHHVTHELAKFGFRMDRRGICHLPRRGVFRCLAAVKGIWQAATIICLGLAGVRAAEAARELKWDPPKVTKSIFTRDLGMLDSEREEYATNLAGLAVNEVVSGKAAPASLAEARRMIALALQLSPRNKRALVANFQLSKGIMPEVPKTDYSPQVFARLLLTRGQLLEKQGGDENRQLARMFIHLAAGMDPKNEDAIYASEMHRLDQGDLDWSMITDPAEEKP
jgi:hypothetical protein